MTTIEKCDNYVMKTYGRFQIDLDRGKGVYLYDESGKKYTDFVGGIAVNAFGYGNKKYLKVMNEQLSKLIHCSNYYYTKPLAETAELLVKKSCFDKVFFCNSGTEANEAALKLMKKYGNIKNKKKIIAMNKSFHGRSIGSLSLTGQAKKQKDFEPLLPNIVFADFNDLDSVEKLMDKNVAGIILEPIQGEGGIYPAKKEFLQGIKKLCDENEALLCYDEVQCGIGRVGTLFSYEFFGVEPDIITLAKGLGNGIPVGAMLAKKAISTVLIPGDHASTFGGNPLAMASARFVLSNIDGVLENVKKVGKYFKEELQKLNVKEVRGEGLMLGAEISQSARDVELKCIERGILIGAAGENVLRFTPPLVIKEKDVDELIKVLGEIL